MQPSEIAKLPVGRQATWVELGKRILAFECLEGRHRFRLPNDNSSFGAGLIEGVEDHLLGIAVTKHDRAVGAIG